MKVYVVSFHDNSWGAQESSDSIIGVYSTKEMAYKISDKVDDLAEYDDDYSNVTEIELDNLELSKNDLYPYGGYDSEE